MTHAPIIRFITDGKPNDLDHYEGRHGIEDSAMAVREARRAGHSVFGITVDRDGKSWFPRIFGQGGFALVPHPARLPAALRQPPAALGAAFGRHHARLAQPGHCSAHHGGVGQAGRQLGAEVRALRPAQVHPCVVDAGRLVD